MEGEETAERGREEVGAQKTRVPTSSKRTRSLERIGKLEAGVPAALPECGGITCYPIWHRRYRATATDVTRYLFKYNYNRTSAPQRDWIVEDDFDPGRHTDDFSHLKAGGMYMRRNFLDSYDAAHMYMWLCGHEDEFRYVGGTAWPAPAPRDTLPAHIDNYAVPPSLSSNGTAYQPEAPPMLRHS